MTAEGTKSTTGATGAKDTILVVDDDRLVLATVVHGLAQAGYDVIDADNGDDAILLARAHHPRLALLDIRMSGKTGFDVAEYLRDVAHVSFIFLSAFTDEETRARADALGALAYLVKPIEVAPLVSTVNDVFARLGSAEPVPADTAGAFDVDSAPDPVALALGILMHRYSLTRVQAARRLEAQAQDKKLSVAAQAVRIVAAVEELAS